MVKLLFLTNSFSTSCANSRIGKEQSVAFRFKLAQAPTAAALRVRVAMQSPRPIKHIQTSKAAHLGYSFDFLSKIKINLSISAEIDQA